MGCSASKAQAPKDASPKIDRAATEESNFSNNAGSEWDQDEDDDEIIPAVGSLMECAMAFEPDITQLLRGIEEEFQGELQGLDLKFKSKDSLLRKVRKMADRKRVALLNEGREEDLVDIPGLVWDTTDALRYTIILDTERYTGAVKAAMERFTEKGMEANELKNFWPGGDNYQGINDVFRIQTDKSPSGRMLFEIQFHTHESYESKMNSHKFYETFRSSMDPMEKLDNWKALCEAAQKVPEPPGVLEIPEPRTNPNPGELELYCELVLMRNMKNEPTIKARIKEICPFAEKLESNMLSIDELIAMMRRIVDQDSRDSVALQDATNHCHEALNLRLVFPEDTYTKLCQKATWELASHFQLEGYHNGWLPVKEQLTGRVQDNRLGCGLGWVLKLYSVAEDDGVAFTDDECLPCMVTMHTEQSLKVQAEMLEKWQKYRSAKTQHQRVEMAAEIRQMHQSVKVPADAQQLSVHAVYNV